MRAKRVVKRAGEEAKDGGAEKDHKNGHVLPRGRLVVCKVHTREADQQHREYHRAGEVTVDVDCQEALEGILATDSVSYGLTGLVMQVWRYHTLSVHHALALSTAQQNVLLYVQPKTEAAHARQDAVAL